MKNKKVTRLLAIILSLIMVLSLFAGCTSQNTQLPVQPADDASTEPHSESEQETSTMEVTQESSANPTESADSIAEELQAGSCD